MKHIYLLPLLMLTACAGSRLESEKSIMVCGTYTADGSHGVYSIVFDNGKLTVEDSVAANNPSYLALADDMSHIYAVREDGENSGVYTFDFDPATGHFGESRFAAEGNNPCHLAIVGDKIVTANYSGGSVSEFEIGANGIAWNGRTMAAFAGCGPDSVRQKTSHIHYTILTPDSTKLLATDLGADCIYGFAVKDGNITLQDTLQLAPGFGPRHLEFSPDGRFCYLIGELSGDVMTLRYEQGTLTPIATIECDSLHVRGSGDIHVSPDGKYVYASNRLAGDGIRTFAVNDDGTLRNVGYTPTPSHPRNFVISPQGNYLIAACKNDNVIVVYARDKASGKLTPTRERLSLSSPVCLKFVK